LVLSAYSPKIGYLNALIVECDHMSKWADYLITQVSYDDQKKYILKVKSCEDLGNEVGNSFIESRKEVIAKLNRGLSYFTAPRNREGKLIRGQPVIIVKINDIEFIKTEKNDISRDNLGELPEFRIRMK
jgi:hypothetical protein